MSEFKEWLLNSLVVVSLIVFFINLIVGVL